MATIADAIAEENEILQDVPWMASNAPFSNRSVSRSAEPSGAWRKANEGVPSEKSEVVAVTDVIGTLDSLAKHDRLEIDNAPDGL